MYSLVLMAALSGGSSAPGWFLSHGCHGCNGCFGCHGCIGVRWGGHGCHGCGGGGLLSSFFRGGGGCHGCWGCAGCWGCNGCIGTVVRYGCHGCMGYACYGGGCHGCHGGGVVVSPGYAPAPAAGPTEKVTTPPKEKKGTPESRIEPSRARLIVELPADAKLYVDNRQTRTSGRATRSFTTPELQPGHDYYYVLRAEIEQDGKPVAETQRVIVRAGGEVRASFRSLARAKERPAVRTASARAAR